MRGKKRGENNFKNVFSAFSVCPRVPSEKEIPSHLA
jgi:hypothetical protein